MKRILMLLALSTSLFAIKAWAIPIQIVGFTDPVNNRAEVMEGVNTITITNNSNYVARITAFGFDSTSEISGLVSVMGTLDDNGWMFTTDQAVGSGNGNGNGGGGGGGGGTFQFGVTTNTNGSLSGGSPNAGIAVRETGSFTFSFNGSSLGTITNHFVRFQDTGANGDDSDRGIVCTVNCGVPNPPTPVPEPSSLLLLGIGLVGAGFARRRKIAM